ncbi:MAG TPA: class I SAM-dependent methyltransferase [Chitinophagaceae bacterium]|nr:class I SAM-dependent methyltransferase [Chitinophagaceae bacterium]
MSEAGTHSTNEQKTAEAFSRQSAVFDTLYSSNVIIQYKRERVRRHAEQFLPVTGNILELNAGTGEDAIYFAQKGHAVHATDISAGMQQQLKQKVKACGLEKQVTTEICSFTQLEKLHNKGPYDLVFSNFAGLNCTGELDVVMQRFNDLLKPGGIVTMVIMPPFCLWETLLALRGNFKNAFRRFNSSKGVRANVEGVQFLCWYYKPSYITERLGKNFTLLGVDGLCSTVPPSYFENFPKKHPFLFKKLTAFEDKHKSQWPWKNWGDYFIISLRKS